MFVVRSIDTSDIQSFRDALDAVAKESGFLRRDHAPPIEAVSSFVQSNIENNNPQFVAVADDKIVGWCDIVRGEDLHDRHSGELGMGVVAEWRGRGIGRHLLLETVAAADAQNFLRIELSVHSDNANAIQLYRSFGFLEKGRKVKARLRDGVPVDVVLMARLKPDAEWLP